MYENREKNDRKVFEIPALLSCKRGNPELKIQNNIYILDFPTPFSAEFPRSQDKIAGISRIFYRSLPGYFYTYPANSAVHYGLLRRI